MSKEYWVAWFKAFLLSIFLIYGSIYWLNTLNNPHIDVNQNESTPITLNELKIELGHEYAVSLMECDYNNTSDWQNKCDQMILDNHNKSNVKKKSTVDKKNFIENIVSEHFLINLIYFLLFLSFNFQFTLLLNIKKFNELKKIHYYYISDWAINSAPILGVLGTVISFALLVGDAQTDDIQEIFKDSFFNAAITTILGGGIYIINLFFNIFIQSVEHESKNKIV
jgi:hypothetical protein